MVGVDKYSIIKVCSHNHLSVLVGVIILAKLSGFWAQKFAQTLLDELE